MSSSLKEQIRRFWELQPCGARDASSPAGTREFFEEVERQRFQGDREMQEIVRFDRWGGRRILEVGCGLGTDLVRFARAGAEVHAIDLTQAAARATRDALAVAALRGCVLVADGERLPFRSDHFDLVYAWGVLHHTPEPEAAAQEMTRVCRRGGSILAMVYHRFSLFSLQAWIVYGLLRGRPWRSPGEVIGKHVESPGTRSYTRREAAALFGDLDRVRVQPLVTRYDLRIGRRRFLPAWVRRLVPPALGWFLIVRGTRTASGSRSTPPSPSGGSPEPAGERP